MALPVNLERVADAGGWEGREAQRALESIKAIKPAQWKGINESLSYIKDIADGAMGGIFNDIKQGIIDTIELQIGAITAPIKNELNAVINALLAPVMPLLMDLANGIAGAINSWFDFSSTGMWATAGREYFAGASERLSDLQTFQQFTAMGGGSWSEYQDYLRILEARNSQFHAATSESSSQISGARLTRLGRFETSGATGGTLTPTIEGESTRLGEFE